MSQIKTYFSKLTAEKRKKLTSSSAPSARQESLQLSEELESSVDMKRKDGESQIEEEST